MTRSEREVSFVAAVVTVALMACAGPVPEVKVRRPTLISEINIIIYGKLQGYIDINRRIVRLTRLCELGEELSADACFVLGI